MSSLWSVEIGKAADYVNELLRHRLDELALTGVVV